LTFTLEVKPPLKASSCEAFEVVGRWAVCIQVVELCDSIYGIGEVRWGLSGAFFWRISFPVDKIADLTEIVMHVETQESLIFR